jgi:hypothetical protein
VSLLTLLHIASHTPSVISRHGGGQVNFAPPRFVLQIPPAVVFLAGAKGHGFLQPPLDPV